MLVEDHENGDGAQPIEGGIELLVLRGGKTWNDVIVAQSCRLGWAFVYGNGPIWHCLSLASSARGALKLTYNQKQNPQAVLMH